jgi:predicted SnoaL-like aldol condensation-catalyzing enzyme
VTQAKRVLSVGQRIERALKKEWTGIAIFRLKDGQIVEEWANMDNLGRN